MRDGVLLYSIYLKSSFLLLADLKDAVKSRGGYLAVLQKRLRLINILKCQVLLTEVEAYHCLWAATVNWDGGFCKNIEIDLFQDNQNREIKN